MDLAVCSPIEIKDITGLEEEAALDIVTKAKEVLEQKEIIRKSTLTAREIYTYRKEKIDKLPTGSTQLDELMGGGLESESITEFYGNQGCDILPDEGDRDFILDLINENWADTTTEFIDILKNSYTEWEDCWEDGNLVSRITEIRYDNKAITKIPNSIADLDSLRWLELQNNQIEIIPGYIGSLKKLKHFMRIRFFQYYTNQQRHL